MTNDRCDGCQASFDVAPRAPMLIDATWAKLAEPQEVLCASCMLNRSIERRVGDPLLRHAGEAFRLLDGQLSCH